jgi:hypothetical protein
MKGVEPAEQEEKAQDADHDPLDERKFDDSGYHGVRLDSNSKEESRAWERYPLTSCPLIKTAPFVTIRCPDVKPSRTRT